MKTLSRSATFALLALAVCVSPAGATTVKCQRAIAKATSQFVQAKVKALSKCNEGVVKNGSGTCPDSKASTSIQKATDKLRATIDKSCGGSDKVCNGDKVDEDTPITLGWSTQCPNFNDRQCLSTILDCGDIATCVACIGEEAADQAISLYYDSLVPATTGDLNKCQVAVGKATSAYLNSSSKALQKCWDAKLNGKIGPSANCIDPNPGDGKYQAAISKAEGKKVSAICKACGGADKQCDGNNDFTPAQIGFPSTCPSVTVPGGSACGGPVTTLAELVACVDCVTKFKADCIDRATVPEFTSYPAECSTCVDPDATGACPTTLTFTADGPNVDLDTGFTGLAHNAHVPTNGRLTLAVSGCANASHPCGVCNVNGPQTNTGGIEFNNHRCQNAPWITCNTDPDCGGSGPCIFFFGSPLPLVAGGVSTCVVNEVSGPVSGTADVEAGSSNTNVPLRSKVHPTGTVDHPCPICGRLCLAGANSFLPCASNTDCPGSTCSPGNICGDGPRINQACSPQGSSQFGDVTLDCPPNPGSNAGTLSINLNISTGTQSVTLTAASPSCRASGVTGLKCFCDTCNNVTQGACFTDADCPISGGNPGVCGGKRCIGGTNAGAPCAVNSECPSGNCNRPGEPTRPNVCLDDTTTGPVEGCMDIGGNQGQCEFGPADQVCSFDTFRTCSVNSDCNPPPIGTCANCTATLPTQTCSNQLRPCFTDNGVIGNAVSVAGATDVPCGDRAFPTVGTFFCVAPVGSTSVNAAGGLPALGRVRIPGRVDVSGP
jgi:hypothetical protein